jgi:SAM-dependent methyltransferase
MKVLNVGGGSREIAIPPHYQGWTHHLLDIDPAGKPDIACDARELTSLDAAIYDAVYCSHNIEHYYPHDVPKVLRGFLHVLKPDGFAEIRCPDVGSVMRTAVERGLDVGDVLYESPAGPITVHDVIYGYGREIARSGRDFYAHKTGFTRKTLGGALAHAGFFAYAVGVGGPFELKAVAFKAEPTAEQKKLLGLPNPPAPPSNRLN